MSLGPSARRHVSMIHMQYATFLHILFKCCRRVGMTAHRLTSMTYFQKVYKCCRHAVMMAQTLMFFTLKDIAKLNSYCEATPYSHMWHMNVPTHRHVCVLGYIIIMCILFTFLHILFKCCRCTGMMAHRLTTMTYFQKVYKCCRHAVMTAQTVMFFPLKDIAKLNTYCEARPYSHMWHVNVPTRRHVCLLGYIIIMCSA